MQDVFWFFDHSSGHTAYASDALNASKMNVIPGGAQPKMRNTISPSGGSRIYEREFLVIVDSYNS